MLVPVLGCLGCEKATRTEAKKKKMEGTGGTRVKRHTLSKSPGVYETQATKTETQKKKKKGGGEDTPFRGCCFGRMTHCRYLNSMPLPLDFFWGGGCRISGLGCRV